MDFFSQLFTALSTEDSIIIISFLVLAFLLGLLGGLFLSRGTNRRLRKELREKEKEAVTLQAELAGAQENLELRTADLTRSRKENEELRSKIQTLSNENNQLQTELYGAKDQLEQYRARVESDATVIEDLNNQILGLKAKQSQLMEKGGKIIETPVGSAAGKDSKMIKNIQDKLASLEEEHNRITALEAKIESLEAQNLALSASSSDSGKMEINPALVEKIQKLDRHEAIMENLNQKVLKLESDNAGLKSIATKIQKLESDQYASQKKDGKEDAGEIANIALVRLEDRLVDLERENELLKRDLDQTQSTVTTVTNMSFPKPSPDELEPLSSLEKGSSSAQKLEAQLGVNIKKATLEEKDDLTLIEGVGPFLEQKLNSVGIYTYDQVASFDNEIIEQVTNAIAYLPGRIMKDDWVGQAQQLLQKRAEGTLQAPAPAPQDLKIIEGIGPKIEEILNNAKILSWEQLANQNPEHLKTILSEAGDHFKVHNPTTWPEQARMAHEGKFEELKAYQEYLTGGKDKK